VIGDTLGKFLHVDPQFLVGQDRRVGRLLVEFDLQQGLPVDLVIEWHDFVYQQRLDYLGVSFRCATCKATGHLKHHCPGVQKIFPSYCFDSEIPLWRWRCNELL
jgi:hypothetical protein